MDSSKVGNLDFPLYACKCLGDENFIVAGGGGSAATGVRNSIQIVNLQRSHRNKVVSTCVDELTTGNVAVMKLAVAVEGQANNQFTLATAQQKQCLLYSVQKTKANSDQSNSEKTEGLKRRKKSNSEKANAGGGDDTSRVDKHNFKLLHTYTISDEDKVQQTSVALSREGKIVAAGLSNGRIKLWNTMGECKLLFDISSHTDEVKDLDFSPDGERLASISSDGTACLWNVKTGHKVNELHSLWNMNIVSRAYRFRNSVFAMNPATREKKQEPSNYTLYSTHQIVKRTSVKDKTAGSYVTKWVRDDKDTNQGMKAQIIQKLFGNVSALSVSRDGHFVSIGFMDGYVEIYIAFRLQLAHRVHAHNLFVTSLSLMDDVASLRDITGDVDARCVSVCPQGVCHLAILKPRALFTGWFILFILILLAAGAVAALHFNQML